MNRHLIPDYVFLKHYNTSTTVLSTDAGPAAPAEAPEVDLVGLQAPLQGQRSRQIPRSSGIPPSPATGSGFCLRGRQAPLLGRAWKALRSCLIEAS